MGRTKLRVRMGFYGCRNREPLGTGRVKGPVERALRLSTGSRFRVYKGTGTGNRWKTAYYLRFYKLQLWLWFPGSGTVEKPLGNPPKRSGGRRNPTAVPEVDRGLPDAQKVGLDLRIGV
jgi:hypothetical protein